MYANHVSVCIIYLYMLTMVKYVNAGSIIINMYMN